MKPEKVIPFVVTKEQAQKQFEDYFKGKRLLPNIFLNGRNRISEMRRLYVPYWLFSCRCVRRHGVRRGKGAHGAKGRVGNYPHEALSCAPQRRMRLENIPVDGSVKMDDQLTESLEPYDLSAAIPFQSAVLAGAMADHAERGLRCVRKARCGACGAQRRTSHARHREGL